MNDDYVICVLVCGFFVFIGLVIVIGYCIVVEEVGFGIFIVGIIY